MYTVLRQMHLHSLQQLVKWLICENLNKKEQQNIGIPELNRVLNKTICIYQTYYRFRKTGIALRREIILWCHIISAMTDATGSGYDMPKIVSVEENLTNLSYL